MEEPSRTHLMSIPSCSMLYSMGLRGSVVYHLTAEISVLHKKGGCLLEGNFNMSQQSILVKCRSCGAKNRISLVGSTLKPVCGRCKSALEILDRPVSVGSADFQNEVLLWPGLVLVDFWADWCSPCRMVAPILEELAAERAGRLKIVKVNTEQEPGIAAQFGIRSIPSLLLFRDGKLVDQLTGALPKHELVRWIDTSAYVI